MVTIGKNSPKHRDKLLGLGVVTVAVGEMPFLANHLGEPFDLPSHATNMGGSMMVGYMAAALLHKKVAESPVAETAGQARLALGSLGFMACAAVNAVAETRTGTSLLGADFGGTPDFLDWCYGAISGTIMSIYSHKVEGSCDRYAR